MVKALIHEVVDRRVWTAMLLLLTGSVALILERGLTAETLLLGLLAVLAAAAAWGVDNTLSRALAERDPGQVVLDKCLLEALAIGVLTLVSRVKDRLFQETAC